MLPVDKPFSCIGYYVCRHKIFLMGLGPPLDVQSVIVMMHHQVRHDLQHSILASCAVYTELMSYPSGIAASSQLLCIWECTSSPYRDAARQVITRLACMTQCQASLLSECWPAPLCIRS